MRRSYNREQVIGFLLELPGNLYFLAMAVVVLGALGLFAVVAIAAGSWWLLLVLVLPGFWLLMWLDR